MNSKSKTENVSLWKSLMVLLMCIMIVVMTLSGCSKEEPITTQAPSVTAPATSTPEPAQGLVEQQTTGGVPDQNPANPTGQDMDKGMLNNPADKPK